MPAKPAPRIKTDAPPTSPESLLGPCATRRSNPEPLVERIANRFQLERALLTSQTSEFFSRVLTLGHEHRDLLEWGDEIEPAVDGDANHGNLDDLKHAML
jgi:hypothetical protein